MGPQLSPQALVGAARGHTNGFPVLLNFFDLIGSVGNIFEFGGCRSLCNQRFFLLQITVVLRFNMGIDTVTYFPEGFLTAIVRFCVYRAVTAEGLAGGIQSGLYGLQIGAVPVQGRFIVIQFGDQGFPLFQHAVFELILLSVVGLTVFIGLL